MTRALFVALLFLLTAFAGCTDDAGDGPTPGASTCAPPPKSTFAMKNKTNPVAVWETTMGCFAAELYQNLVPITAGNFANLTKKGFYNGTRFHRVIDNFMIQDGDPYSKDAAKKSQWGTGDPGYAIKDEFRADLSHDSPGILSMANSGPNTGGSQYFITLVPTKYLDAYENGKLKKCGEINPATGQPYSCHAVFGKIVWNMENVNKIGKTPTGQADRPLTDVVIKSLVLL